MHSSLLRRPRPVGAPFALILLPSPRQVKAAAIPHRRADNDRDDAGDDPVRRDFAAGGRFISAW
jgi:hypothetical protein